MFRNFIFIFIVLVLNACTTPASISITTGNTITYTSKSTLYACDQALENCNIYNLSMKPEDGIYHNGRLLLVAKDKLYKCNDLGQSCNEVQLPIKDASDIAVGPNNVVIITSNKGKVVLCPDGVRCSEKAPSSEN